MQVNIELDMEQISSMVFHELRESRDQFLEDLECGAAVFSLNEAYDKAQIIDHIKALELIMEWYRDPSDPSQKI